MGSSSSSRSSLCAGVCDSCSGSFCVAIVPVDRGGEERPDAFWVSVSCSGRCVVGW